MINRGALIGAAGLLALGAWYAYRQGEPAAPGGASWADGWVQEIQGAAESAAELFGGTMRLGEMRNVAPVMLGERNVQAVLRVIRAGEGTADEAGYRRIVGGSLFSSFADHPRVIKSGTFANGKTWRSSAAGAYQFLASTWDETAGIMGLPDFSPASQDLGALGRIAARGALADVRAGRLDAALAKLGREWASLPGSPYGQPTISAARARAVYAAAGGSVYG